MKAVFITDLHGDVRSLEKVLKYGEERDVEAIIIGGDIGPFLEAMKNPDQSIIQSQREFLEDYLIPKIRNFKRKFKEKNVFIIMGNDDFEVNMDVLNEAEKEGMLKVVHKKVEKLGDKYIIGYSYVNPMPFFLKDWEKPEEYIEKDLEYLGKMTDPKKTIWLFHDTPFDTALDMIHNGQHVGSVAIKRFINETQPMLTLHGHIHESPEVSGRIYERLGSTISVNPGNKYFVIFDIDNPENMVIIKR